MPLIVLAALTCLSSLFFCLKFWRRTNYDLDVYLIPWFSYLVEHGRFRSLGDAFSNYNPPYLYLLSVTTLLQRVARPETLIRGLSLLFAIVSAWPIRMLSRAKGWRHAQSMWLAVIWAVTPEVLLNSWVWGQCDVIYTAALMGSVYLLIRGKGITAMALYGLALAFKLQAVFLAPFFLWCVVAGAVPSWSLLAVPCVFFISLLPAAAAGRPWAELLTIYVHQPATYPLLALNAPNMWTMVQQIRPDVNLPGSFGMLVRVGVGWTAAMSGWLIWRYRRVDVSPATLLFAAVLCSLLVPYCLPLMHERYFFPASALSFMLAVWRPCFWPVAVLVNIANSLSYTNFLYRISAYPMVGAALTTSAIILLISMRRFASANSGLPATWRLAPSLQTGPNP